METIEFVAFIGVANVLIVRREDTSQLTRDAASFLQWHYVLNLTPNQNTYLSRKTQIETNDLIAGKFEA